MSVPKLCSTIFGLAVLPMVVVLANAQTTSQAAREQARNAVRSHLHLKPDQFLGVQRSEKLEELLVLAVGRPGKVEFIYQVGPAEMRLRKMLSSTTSSRTLIPRTLSRLARGRRHLPHPRLR